MKKLFIALALVAVSAPAAAENLLVPTAGGFHASDAYLPHDEYCMKLAERRGHLEHIGLDRLTPRQQELYQQITASQIANGCPTD